MKYRSALIAPVLALAIGCETRPDLDLSATALNFGTLDNVLELRIKNAGKQELHWSAVTETEWIASIDPELGTLDEDSEETIDVRINRAGLPIGDHVGSLRIIANGEHPEETIEVRCRIETIDELVSVPNVPTGPSSLCTGEQGSYTASGSASSWGHDIEYQFDWGDGELSTWGSPIGARSLGEGSYCVKVRARCALDPEVVSEWSECLQVEVAAESVIAPNIPTGPTSGGTQQLLSYASSGASSSCGHNVQIQFDWGDGVQSSWGSGLDSHSWDKGMYCIKTRARCEIHPAIESDWTECLNVSIATGETVSAPAAPAGPSDLCIDVSADYVTGGASSNLDHPIEYQFDWDGSVSAWGPSTLSHSWGEGTYCVRARARCVTHPNVVSAWSICSTVVVAEEAIVAPATPSGPASGSSGEVLSYSTGGAASTCGHPLQYQFDWGDDNTSSWGSPTRTHGWSAGSYCVQARARCATHTNFVSDWSPCFAVTIGTAETVSTPSEPSGPASLCIGVPGNYTTGGAFSNLSHEVEYQFDWGDGNQSPWGAAAGSHDWPQGSYCVQSRARCVTHPSIVSNWSVCHTVNVAEETIATPAIPIGPTNGSADDTLSYTTSGGSSSCGHAVEYQFDWGDGNTSVWGGATQVHNWVSGGYCVKARARCVTHPTIVSDWTECLNIVIGSGETISAPSTPAGPSLLCIGANGSYSTGGSTSSMGHAVEYQFDWGDGTQSGWGTSTRSHSWSAGSYCVKTQARCVTHTGIVSAWSICNNVDVGEETVTTATIPTGPTSGSADDTLTYTTGGSTSSCGHSLQYQFDWGDGETSAWGSTTRSHSWDAGNYYIKAQARCATHHEILSAWSDSLNVVIAALESVTAPAVPSGPASLCAGISADYTTGGSTSSLGHTVEYQFEWDDGTLSQWGSATTRSHSWNEGAYCVRTRARCATHTTIESSWSACRTVNVDAEIVAAPSTPSGPTSGDPGELLSYTATGASSSCGHTLEYQFDWGDGNQTGWGTSDAQHSFSAGSYCVRARARCSAHTSIVSGWSTCLTVNIASPETVSTPIVPAGPSTLCIGVSADFMTGGSTSSLGHSVEYQFEWDDGTLSQWGSATTRSHSWNEGAYCVRARARCATHTTVESSWSACHTVNVEVESVSAPQVPSGPIQGEPGEDLAYSAGGASSTCGHPVQVQFDWGDGSLSSWGSGTDSHSFAEGSYCVKARSRCATHTSVESPWSDCLDVTIAIQEAVSAPDAPSGAAALCEGSGGNYSTGGAASNLGHTLEYQFDWDDGTLSAWGASSDSHVFGAGAFCVRARARCATHTLVESGWSSCFTVTADAHVVSVPSIAGPTEGLVDSTYCYEASGSGCSCGHSIDHYEFDFGPSVNQAPCMTWDLAGTYCVRARAFCTENHPSAWSECLYVEIQRSVFLELNCAPGCNTLLFVSNFYENMSLVSNCPGTGCNSPNWDDCAGCGIRIRARESDCDFYPSSSGTDGLVISPAATQIDLSYRAVAEDDGLAETEEVEMQICLDGNCTPQPVSTHCDSYRPSFELTQPIPRKIRVSLRGSPDRLDLLVGESTTGAVIRYDFPGWLVADEGSFSGTVVPIAASGTVIPIAASGLSSF